MGENYLIVRVKPKRSFIAKHKRWFSLASTAVVLGTFIVNEALRNQSKDLADSIANAQSNFIIRSDLKTTGNKLEAINDRVTNINNGMERLLGFHDASEFHPTPLQSTYLSEIETAEVDMTSSDMWSLQFDNTMALYSKLPYDRSLDDQHWAISRFNDAYREYFDDARILSNAFDSGDMKKSAAEYAIVRGRISQKEARRAEMLLIFKQPAIQSIGLDPLDLFTTSVVQRARKVQEHAEAQANLWRDMSFFLYPFGLAIGFVGKLGDDEPPLDEAP